VDIIVLQGVWHKTGVAQKRGTPSKGLRRPRRAAARVSSPSRVAREGGAVQREAA